jgi:hypothetical protein
LVSNKKYTLRRAQKGSNAGHKVSAAAPTPRAGAKTASQSLAPAGKLTAIAFAIAICLVLTVGAAGFFFMSSHSIADATDAASMDDSTQIAISFSGNQDDSVSDESVLKTAVKRDMSPAINQVKAEEEAARLAAEEAARQAEEQAINRAIQAQAKSAAAGGVGVYEVDFTIGREAFIAQWTERINNYLAGSPLAGYGSTFATAAWEAGIDPRWSPAISNTESSKGTHCFASHNAWGWTGGEWSDWESAITAHINGLANGYGFTLSQANAAKYCPPNTDYWYNTTLSEMQKI